MGGVFNLVYKGSRWIISNGESVHIGRSRWLPRPYSFKPIILGEPSYADQLVSALICKEADTWREELLPLCTSWPSDKLIWHFVANGLFSVRSAYHLAWSLKLSSMASSSFHGTKDFWRLLWEGEFPSVMDCLLLARDFLDNDELGEFVAILWEYWNSRNKFLSGTRRINLHHVGKRARAFVHNYRKVQMDSILASKCETACSDRKPPDAGYLKLNVDAGRLEEGNFGWGFVLRDHLGGIVMAGSCQGMGFQGAELEETRACLFALNQVQRHGHDRLIVESDCLSLVSKLRKKEAPNNSLGFFISDIFQLVFSFQFISFVQVKRG
ncbi:hypothetical protein Cgig2_018161 [Carnegiea gigantea]|uniref:RNase H type-1 domain-containing protein n=1 Tax=Carnegiea gigantea TaxID=171969 RepID=A0A9Q1QR63_9CARY|nr:hypothetical protein Cgig2_018161 [Carnegiea gigantea]